MRLEPGTVIVCPACRVFVDKAGLSLPSWFPFKCPWCAASNPIAAYAEAAERDLCAGCGHPACAHVAWYTSDGGPPHPLTRATARAVDAPCVLCAHDGRVDCTLRSGAIEVAS